MVGLSAIEEGASDQGASDQGQILIFPTTPVSTDPESETGREQVRQILERAIDEIPQPFRMVFIMRDIQGLDVEDAVDDASRLAYTEILPDERQTSACAVLARAFAFFQAHGVTVERVMTDNGSAYRSRLFRAHIAQAGCKHIRTRPYTPRTSGKAERFIQTSLREWAYRNAYQTSAERAQALQPWINRYNHSRPHSALGGNPPLTRLNNALGFDT